MKSAENQNPCAAVGWTICRGYSELWLTKELTLQRWAERGRILSDDYLFDKARETWVRARDLPELMAFFRRRTVELTERAIGVLLVGAMLSAFVVPLFATLLLVGAGVCSILGYRLERLLEKPAIGYFEHSRESGKSNWSRLRDFRTTSAARRRAYSTPPASA